MNQTAAAIADWEGTQAAIDGAAVPRVATRLTWRDRRGGWAARWGIGRMDFRVGPGLYAAGRPDPGSPVLVTANYKLSFDALRRELAGIDAWILVLDTKGINVWCAAGKGTFGTQELIQRVAAVRLADKVRHRRLILPQLGAVGVAAPVVKAFCGFTVVWGPVRAADLPAFLAAGQKKTAAMRTIRFDWRDRLVLTPIELVQSAKWVPVLLLLALALALPTDGAWAGRAAAFGLLLGGAWPVGAVLFPLLLPWLPFRAFGLKGLVLGLGWAVLAGLAGLGLMGLAPWHGAAARAVPPSLWTGLAAAALAAVPGIVFLAMNFTGSSTFTNQAGATAEVKRGLPLLAASLGMGLAAGLASVLLRTFAGI
jgi:hypothetical protein